MNYRESVDYIHSLLKFGIKPGFDRITALLDEVGNPQDELKVIHIAGTNGKGSTCSMISSALIAAGYKTGLFISPYVVNFRERIQINGTYIPEDELARLASVLKPIADKNEAVGNGPTEFEFITALAFMYFKESGCDYVVLETGLGGRLDSTNVVKKPLAVGITNIALDHTAVLGGTVEQIAAEKCGIIKEGVPVVISPQRFKAAEEIIFSSALNLDCDVTLCNMDDVEISRHDCSVNEFTYLDERYITRLIGEHQIKNAVCAIEILKSLKIEYSHIYEGLASAFIPSRCEVLHRDPTVILDGAHNPDGVRALAASLAEYGDKFTAIIGMMADKNYDCAVRVISPKIASAVTVEVESNERSLTAAELADTVRQYVDDVVTAKNYDDALRLAAKKMGDNPLVIFGSFYLSSDIRQKAIEYFKNSF